MGFWLQHPSGHKLCSLTPSRGDTGGFVAAVLLVLKERDMRPVDPSFCVSAFSLKLFDFRVHAGLDAVKIGSFPPKRARLFSA